MSEVEIQLRHPTCYVMARHTLSTSTEPYKLEWFYTDSESEEYKLQKTNTSFAPFTMNGITMTAQDGPFLLVDIDTPFFKDSKTLESNTNFGITYSMTEIQQKISDDYTNLDAGALGYTIKKDAGCLDGVYNEVFFYTGDTLSLSFSDGGNPRDMNFRIATSITATFGIYDGPRFRINNASGTLDVIDENDVSYGGLSITSSTYWNEYEIQDHGDQFDFRVNDRKSGPSVTKQFCKVVGIKKKGAYDALEIEALDDGIINIDYIITGDGKWETFW